MRMAPLWRRGALAVALLFAGTATANTDDLQTLIKSGRYAEALQQADRLLADKPKDAQLRFLRGLALTELGRADDAVEVFQSLTADFPELPEPYNNLAVLYAQQKQFDKARTALEMAIRTHPAYATAHENLGDVYSRLASQAYSKALQLDNTNATAQTKLALVRELITSTGAPPAAAARAQAVATAKAAPAVAPPAAKPAAVAVAAANPSAAAPAAPAATEPRAAPNDGAGEAIRRTVLDWAAAWSRKDVAAYLAFYGDEFVIPGGRSRAAWESERRARVGKPGSISVELEDLQVEVDGAKAVARFRQHYNSDSFSASASKMLELTRSGNSWRIRREVVGG